MAINRDTGGSTFPVIDTISSSAVGTKTTTAFSTNAAATLFILTIGWRGNANVVAPLSVAWHTATPSGASTWTLAKRMAITGTGANSICSEIWYATATSALTSVSIDITKSGATETDECASIELDALTGASSSITNTGGNASASGSAVNKGVTLSGVVAGSWLYWGYSGDGSTVTAQSGTTIAEQHDDANGAGLHSAVGYNSSGTSGSITVGATGTQTFSACAAIEVAVAATAFAADEDAFFPRSAGVDAGSVTVWG